MSFTQQRIFFKHVQKLKPEKPTLLVLAEGPICNTKKKVLALHIRNYTGDCSVVSGTKKATISEPRFQKVPSLNIRIYQTLESEQIKNVCVLTLQRKYQ